MHLRLWTDGPWVDGIDITTYRSGHVSAGGNGKNELLTEEVDRRMLKEAAVAAATAGFVR